MGLRGTLENKCLFTQLTSKYLLGGIAAVFVLGVAGGGAQGGVLAGAAGVGGTGGGWAETGAVTAELKDDFSGMSFPVMGRMTGGLGCSSGRLDTAAASD